MWKWLMVALIAVAGSAVALQGATNARMSAALQFPLASALLNFIVGATLLAPLTFSGVFGRIQWSGFATAPWWAYIGGVFGAVFVTTAILAVPRVGAAVTFAAIMCGQLVCATLLDTYGWLGLHPVPLSSGRIIGLALLIVGVLLVQRG